MENQQSMSSIQFRYGGAGTEVKLYFNEPNDLLEKLKNLNIIIDKVRENIDKIKKELNKDAKLQ